MRLLLAVIDHLRDHGNDAHLPHQRRVKDDFLHTIENRASAGRQVGALGRREVNQQDIAGVAFIYHWKDRRITHEAAIPMVLSANLWCACPEWHAIRSDDMLGSNL